MQRKLGSRIKSAKLSTNTLEMDSLLGIHDVEKTNKGLKDDIWPMVTRSKRQKRNVTVHLCNQQKS
jgi:hypothetical protein